MRVLSLIKAARKAAIICEITVAATLFAQTAPASAQTAGDVMTKMAADHRTGYINGVVEGLAFARWLKDKPNAAGMTCIYDWHYRKEPIAAHQQRVFAWLERHPDKPVGALIHALLKKECGE